MTNGKRWIAEIIIGSLALALTAWGTWTAAVRTDAAFHQRVETFMEENQDDLALLHGLTTTAAVHSEQIGELARAQSRTDASVKSVADNVQMYLQTQMRFGVVPR